MSGNMFGGVAVMRDGTFMIDACEYDIEEARREFARPDGVITIYGIGKVRPHGRHRWPERASQIQQLFVPPWPFNLGPNGALFLLLAMEAPILILAVIKALTD